MEIPLHPEVEKVVLEKVARGDYRSVAEMVEEALFLLVERDWANSQADLLKGVPTAFDPPTEAPTGDDLP
jgi:Arc/MetJ-type ribon-helix-helix transcriptional regulator